MGTISADLLKFKNSVDGNIDNMNTNCNNLVTTMQSISDNTTSFCSQLSSYYKSSNSGKVLESFGTVKEGFLKIKTSLSESLSPIISSASDLLDKIKELEKINEIIEEQQTIINNNSGDSETEKSNKDTANAEITKQNEAFDKLHEEAKNLLNSLKSSSASVDLGDLGNVQASGLDEIKVDGGTLQPASYKASNGQVVNYYIYVPNVVESTEKLPMLVYFHGIKDTIEKNNKNGNKNGGLAGLIQQGVIEPKGICIFPQAVNGTPDSAFVTRAYEEAVLELTDQVAAKYNGDKNRLSVAGHSNGSAAVYHIVNNYPGRFAAAAPICSPGSTKEGIIRTNLYTFAGSNDTPANQGGIGIANSSRKNGGNALSKMYYGYGHDIQTVVFMDDLPDENGNRVKLIDWLMSKSLNG